MHRNKITSFKLSSNRYKYKVIYKTEFCYTNGYLIDRLDIKNNMNEADKDEHKMLFIVSYCYVYTRLRRISLVYRPSFQRIE